jgi:Ca2+-binding RTX toxin-like protein
VREALEGLSTVGAGNVAVERFGNVYRVSFQGTLADSDQPLLSTDDGNLTAEGPGDVLVVDDSAEDSASVALLTPTSLVGLDMGGFGEPGTSFNEIQTLRLDADGGWFSLGFGNDETGELLHDVSAASLQQALENLDGIGTGNVRVDRNDDVYVIRFRGLLSNTDVAPLTLKQNKLTRTDELPGGEVVTGDAGSGSLELLTRTAGIDAEARNERQRLVLSPSDGSFTLAFGTAANATPSLSLAGLTPAEAIARLTLALEALEGISTGDVAITRSDAGFDIEFQRELANRNLDDLITTGAASIAGLQNGGDTGMNDVQVLTVDATAGSYRLQLEVPGLQDALLTLPIEHDASAADVRQALQDALARELNDLPEGADLSRVREAFKNDFTVVKYGNDYVIGFQGMTAQLGNGPGVGFLVVDADAGFDAHVETRMDGINYYGIERLDIALGSGHDVLNVQGTSAGSFRPDLPADDGEAKPIIHAATNIDLAGGNDQIFVSSLADLDHDTISETDDKLDVFEFLRGDLDAFAGNLNLAAGEGRHRLLVSDEAASQGDGTVANPATVSDVLVTPTGLGTFDDLDQAEIQIQGLATGDISYGAQLAGPGGNFYDGIAYWTGSGDDALDIDGTHARASATERTITLLNTGLGDDHVTVDLDTGEDDFFALHTMGGARTPSPVVDLDDPSGETDDDTVRAADSTLPLIIFGGLGNDDIVAGQNKDIVFGDLGRLQYLDHSSDPLTGPVLATLGFGGRGDVISSRVFDPLQTHDPIWVLSRDLTLGGVDIIEGGEDEDILIGGAGGTAGDTAPTTEAEGEFVGHDDFIDGDADDDLIFGDAVELMRRPGVVSNPRFQSLRGQVIYSRYDLPAFLQGLTDAEFPSSGNEAGEVLVDGIALDYRDPDGLLVGGDPVPAWAEYLIVDLFHSFAIEAGGDPVTSFGDDYIAGGAGHDMIFGQLGHDTIQGDGAIEGHVPEDEERVPGAVGEAAGANRVAAALAGLNASGARRVVDDADATIQLTPTISAEKRSLHIVASFEAMTDGDDYIEGNGGDDVIFGNLGQDDIIGGSSSLFTLGGRDEHGSALRPDGSDILFGGSGERSGHDHDVTDVNRNSIVLDDVHARDSDVIAGDNANIYRVVAAGAVTDPSGGVTPGIPDTGGFLEYGYDAVRGIATHRIIVRAVELLDYTPGGPDFAAVLAAMDIGGADEIHGESGDDFIYGMKGPDVLFGDSEDDDLIGGWGPDWISGGTDMDGVIGDDGRILTARYALLPGTNTAAADPSDPAHYAELLNGVFKVDQLNKVIRTPGDIQKAIINPTLDGTDATPGEIFKSVDLTPFNLDPDTAMQDRLFVPFYANDIIFGGLGNDFLHGSAGDDAISGAEALPEFFAAPINPDDPTTGDPNAELPQGGDDLLRFDANRIEFADYDEEFPRRQLDPFVLGFDPAGDPNTALDANDNFDEDAIFGDLGNDWLVGGPDNDNLFGGFGADLLDADDDKTTNPENDAPDPVNIDIQDRAYGGAGRDVLVANTGGDRLIDWVAEFNSFIVPFAPFGEFTVTRGVPPHLFDFLYELSASLGADPTRAADTGNLPAERNGEPDGELGLVTQNDGDLWQNQTGAPIDPQPGNIPGGERLTLRGVDFNGGTAQGFAADTGNWEVSAGRFEVSPVALGDDAVSVFHVGEYLPTYFEMAATINAGKPIAGLKSNAYMIFDYQAPDDFKFAGVNISIDKIQMGYRDASGWHVTVQTPARLKPNTDYDLLLAVNGLTATLVVDGADFFSHAFAPRIDPHGYSHGLNEGMVGIGANNSVGRIDNVSVRILYPEITFEHEDDFSDGAAEMFSLLTTGDWQVFGGRFEGGPALGETDAFSTFDLDVGPNSILTLEGTLTADSFGGFFFDYYGAHDYKFAGVLPGSDEVVIGHWGGSGLIYDTVAPVTFAAGPEFDLRLSLKGTTVSLSIDGYEVVGNVFNAVVVDGAFGLLASAGGASFDSISVATDDPAYFDPPGENLVASSLGPELSGATLDLADLDRIVDEAIRRWDQALDLSEGALAGLGALSFRIADLDGLLLGRVSEDTVWLDVDAAGHGWYVDETPEDDAEFRAIAADGTLRATPASEGSGAMDLLSVVTHELGHALGLDAHELLSDTLDVGERVVPDVDGEDTAGRSDSASFEYAVRVLAAERWLEGEEDEDDHGQRTFEIREISLDFEDAVAPE